MKQFSEISGRHGGDPHMRDESPVTGFQAVIPALNRMAQCDEQYRAWVADEYDEDGELRIPFRDFDEMRADWMYTLYDHVTDVVEAWTVARDRAPIGQ